MKKIVTFFCILIVSIAVLPTDEVLGHGEAGMTLTGSAEGYTGDVDYDATIVEAGVPGRFVFNLFKGNTIDVMGTGVEFNNVWVRVIQQNESKNGKAIFAGPILKPLFGGTGMTLALPEAGEYTIHVRYNEDDEKIVEISYPLTVYAVAEKDPFEFNLEFFVGLGGGFVSFTLLVLPVWIFGRKKTTNTETHTKV